MDSKKSLAWHEDLSCFFDMKGVADWFIKT
jgi:hypothetical protein